MPSHIGRYRVERELGRGAMGVIYRAEDPDIGRTVAIKLVRADLLEGEDRDAFLARFRHEARAAGRCAHPNIVAVYDFALHDGNPFLAMEYVDGIPLGEALKRGGPFAPAEAVAIAAQLLDALGAAHALGIVHRDVKPANILVLANETPNFRIPNFQIKVTDFGISHLNTSDLTQDGTVIGTPAYMSPEQCRGENVDARSDLFSAGAVLYELLSGTRAFGGRNVTEVTYRLLNAEPRDLTEIAPAVPAALAGVVRHAMAKAKEARYQSAQAMADALHAASREAQTAESAGDLTVVMPARPAFEPAAGSAIDETALDTIERRLARHVGPIARHLVRDAARRTNSIEALCETVARNIGQAAERERFLSENLASPHRTAIVSRPPGSARPDATSIPAASLAGPSAVASSLGASVGGIAPASRIPLAAIERAERALAQALGPIAKLLVKRALPNAASEAALWERLAAHIERPSERDAFLRQRPG